jgi:hypothetical protein
MSCLHYINCGRQACFEKKKCTSDQLKFLPALGSVTCNKNLPCCCTMSFELKWSSDACNAALTESSHAIISLGKRKRDDQDSVVDSIDERAALLSIRRLRLGYHSNAHKIISVSNSTGIAIIIMHM